MYTLYYMPGAASFSVHWLLLEIGAPHELKRVDGEAGEQKSPGYLKLNPNGVVPTLVVGGEPMYETAALMQLLAARHPAARLLPTPRDPGGGSVPAVDAAPGEYAAACFSQLVLSRRGGRRGPRGDRQRPRAGATRSGLGSARCTPERARPVAHGRGADGGRFFGHHVGALVAHDAAAGDRMARNPSPGFRDEGAPDLRRAQSPRRPD